MMDSMLKTMDFGVQGEQPVQHRLTLELKELPPPGPAAAGKAGP